MKTMDKILIILAVFLLVFIAIMIWLYYRTEGIPDTLCSCVFAVCGGECGVMGWIKTNKDRMQDREYEMEMQTEQEVEDNELDN
jgi:hypothetical protein